MNDHMRIIGLDPGYDRLGVAVMEGSGNDPTLLFSTCITTDRKSSFAERLSEIGKSFTEIIDSYRPDIVALETLFFNKNITTAIEVAEARGTLIYISTLHGAKISEYSPQAVKVAVTGYGNSDKHAVINMVKRLVPMSPVNTFDDEYDAIAVGITCLAHHSSHR